MGFNMAKEGFLGFTLAYPHDIHIGPIGPFLNVQRVVLPSDAGPKKPVDPRTLVQPGVVPQAARHGFDDICLNNCITAENVEYVNGVADKAKEWGVNINYSAYSPRRTGCRDYFLETSEQLDVLRRELAELKTRIHSRWVTNSITTLDATQRYFETGGAPGWDC